MISSEVNDIAHRNQRRKRNQIEWRSRITLYMLIEKKKLINNVCLACI